jgi:hypothetical protein
MDDQDKDIIFSSVTALILLTIAGGMLYGTYRTGRSLERRALTKALVASIEDTYQDGYKDGYKTGHMVGYKEGYTKGLKGIR